MATVTVIMPAYNVEKEIALSIKDILNQTHEDLELIIINDGSTDGTERVIQSFNDRRIQHINQQNAGVSAARNRGMDLSHGEFILFVDADDRLDSTMIATLYNIANNDRRCDVVVCGVDSFYEGGRQKKASGSLNVLHLSAAEAIDELLYERSIVNAPFAKLFRASFLRKERFPLNISIAEDLLFNYNALLKARSVAIVPRILYFYFVRPGSAMNSQFSEKRMSGLVAVKKLVKDSKKRSLDIQYAALCRLFMESMYIAVKIPLMDKRHRRFLKECLANIGNLQNDVIRSRQASAKTKLFARSASIHPLAAVVLAKCIYFIAHIKRKV